jgi:hypothetical protein
VAADLAAFDLGVERWDGVVSIWCHLPPALRAQVYRGVVAALRPGGVLLLEAYTPEQLSYRTGGPPTVELLLSLAQARAELAGLDFIEATERVREVHEGKCHDGTSAVLQLVARKPPRRSV